MPVSDAVVLSLVVAADAVPVEKLVTVVPSVQHRLVEHEGRVVVTLTPPRILVDVELSTGEDGAGPWLGPGGQAEVVAAQRVALAAVDAVLGDTPRGQVLSVAVQTASYRCESVAVAGR